MLCPHCGSKTTVKDSRPIKETTRRRRICPEGHNFYTWETRTDPFKDRESRRKAAHKKWHAKSREERKLIKQREHRRADARLEAAATGKPVKEIYLLWGL